MRTTNRPAPCTLLNALCLAAFLWAVAPPQAYAQTLDEPQTLNRAIEEQLKIDPVPCAKLLGDDDVSVFDGTPLSDICNRNPIQRGEPTTSGGGSAATPPSAPSSVESRLDEKEPGEIRRGFFLSAGYDSIDKQVSPFEDGYDSDVVRLAGGFDFLIGNNWILGIVADGSVQSGDFLGEGDFETRTYGITGFGSYLIGDASSFDFYAGYARQSHDRARHATYEDPNAENADGTDPFRVEGDPVADFDSGQILFGLNFSYDWSFDNVTLGPRVSYDWVETDYDTFTETDPENSGLALTFYENSEDSSIFSAGLAGSVAISTNFGVLLIEQNLFYRYEAGMDQRDIEVSFAADPRDTRDTRFTYQTDEPDNDFLQYSFTTRFLLANNWEWMLDYTGISSHRYLSRDAVVLGFRKGF